MKFIIRFCPESVKSYDMMAELLLVGENKPFDDYPRRKSMLKGEVNECLSRIRLLARSVPYTANLSSRLIPIPANFKSGGCFTSSLVLKNTSVSELSYSWSVLNINEKLVKVDINSPSGILCPNGLINIDVRLTAYLPGHIDAQLVCMTADGLGPTMCVAIIGQVQLKPRSLAFDADIIDFGLFPLGDRRIIQVPLTNNTPYSIYWSISTLNPFKSDQLIQIKPSSGMLHKNEKCAIKLQYFPTWYEKLHDTLKIYLNSIEVPAETLSSCEKITLDKPMLMSAINVVGVVQTPRMILVNDVNQFSCFLNVPVKWKIDLENVRQLTTYFKWPDIETDTLIAKFYPSEGMLDGGQMEQVEVEVRFLKPGQINVDLLGHVEDMVENNGNLILHVEANVVQYEFSFRVLENEDAWAKRAIIKAAHKHKSFQSDLRLDFGLLCPISDVRTRTIKIRNHSAIESEFKIEFKTFTPTLDESENQIQSKDLTTRENNVDSPTYNYKNNVDNVPKVPILLKSTAKNKIGFSSKAGQKYVESITKFRALINQMKQILSDGRGAAFHAIPSQGVIKPWGEVEIKVNSYNNLVGIYKDELICKVEDITQIFPVRLGVIGSPVKFSGAHLISREKEVKLGGIDVEKVNFGGRVINLTSNTGDSVETGNKTKLSNRKKRNSLENTEELLTKVIMVDNHSPRDVLLDWRVYMKHTKIDDSIELSTHPGNEKITTEMIIRPENLIKKDETAIIEVIPSSMKIPAFKSTHIKCIFRNIQLGSYEALVFADIAYIQEDGSYKYAPRTSLDPGKWPVEEPIDKNLLSSGNVKLKDLESAGKTYLIISCFWN